MSKPVFGNLILRYGLENLFFTTATAQLTSYNLSIATPNCQARHRHMECHEILSTCCVKDIFHFCLINGGGQFGLGRLLQREVFNMWWCIKDSDGIKMIYGNVKNAIIRGIKEKYSLKQGGHKATTASGPPSGV
jgi:hypothetical protein